MKRLHVKSNYEKNSHLRNKFDFWNVHGIMNTYFGSLAKLRRTSRLLCKRTEVFMIP